MITQQDFVEAVICDVACECLYLGAGPSGSGGTVASVFGRVGAVVALLGDYDSSLIGDTSTLGGPTVKDSLSAANTAIGAAQSDATQALSDASAAQSDATQALADSATAQADATQALADSATAQADATQALTDAATAQGAADSAQADATQALADASAAQSDATQALADAATAQSAANAAQSTANAAVVASGGTLTGGTLSGTTTVTGTLNASGATAVSVPTVAFPDSDTSAASTAFVSVNFAPINNAALTGTPTAPTQADTDSSTRLATTEYVTNSEDPARSLRLVDHFASGQVTGDLGWSIATNGAGIFAAPNPAVLPPGRRGVFRLNAGTNAANGRAALSFEQAVGQLPFVQPWLTDSMVLEWRTWIALLPVAAVSEYQVGMALAQGAATVGATFFAGVGFTFDILTSPNWLLVSRTAGVPVATVDTGVPIVAGAWRYYRLEIDSVSARAHIGTTQSAAAFAGTIPVASLTTTVALGPLTKTYNAGIGTLGTRDVFIDYKKLRINFGTPT